jgi:preprotein translocase subunit SecG
MVLYYILTTFYVLVCLVLLLVVLLQQGKGGDMASAFGGGSSQTAFGARGGATVLAKATAVLAALFMLSALALAIIGQRGPGSIVSGTPAPKSPARTAPAPVPPNGAPATAPTTAPATPPAEASPSPAPAQPAVPTEQPKSFVRLPGCKLESRLARDEARRASEFVCAARPFHVTIPRWSTPTFATSGP